MYPEIMATDMKRVRPSNEKGHMRGLPKGQVRMWRGSDDVSSGGLAAVVFAESANDNGNHKD